MARHWIATRPDGIDGFELVDYDAPPPARGEVTVRVVAAGMNPADYKHASTGDPADFPKPVGYEVAGVITAIGPDTEIASGAGAVGDEVIAFRIAGGWATELTVAARDVFAKPASIDFDQAAGLLLAATTASEMLHRAVVANGETIVVHGASGAVGVSVLQQAALRGAHVIGTASTERFDEIARFGATPIAHGDGLEQRIRDAAPDGVVAALDCVGVDEAVDASLALVADRSRVVTIAAKSRAAAEGFRAIAGALPDSKAYRDGVRAEIIRLAGEGRLQVPVAGTYPLEQAREAAQRLQAGHPGGKLVLRP